MPAYRIVDLRVVAACSPNHLKEVIPPSYQTAVTGGTAKCKVIISSIEAVARIEVEALGPPDLMSKITAARADGLLLTYKTDSSRSFSSVSELAVEVRSRPDFLRLPILIVGRVSREGPREVKREEGEAFAERVKVFFAETAASPPVDHESIFRLFASAAVRSREKW